MTPKRLHPESLLRIPLVTQMMGDPAVRLSPRAVDCGWFYSQLIPTSVTGFSPHLGAVYYGARSYLAEWLKAPHASTRRLNERDWLLKEVLFAVHDYLHCWAYRAIDTLVPELLLGYTPITAANAETFAFCHLLTEAVATVGLDYWYLSRVDLNEVCDLGTRVSTLSVGYHERHLTEYRRFNPRLDVQNPAFFGSVAEFYCTGVLSGFGAGMLGRSPLLLSWIEHELRYGEAQRRYTRQWLAHLSGGGGARGVTGPSGRPVAVNQRWQHELIGRLGQLLWAKVHENTLHDFGDRTRPPREPWRSPPRARPHYAWLNLNAADSGRPTAAAIFRGAEGCDSFRYFFNQFVSRHEHTSDETELEAAAPEILRLRDLKRLQSIFRGRRRVGKTASEPRDLILQN